MKTTFSICFQVEIQLLNWQERTAAIIHYMRLTNKDRQTRYAMAIAFILWRKICGTY